MNEVYKIYPMGDRLEIPFNSTDNELLEALQDNNYLSSSQTLADCEIDDLSGEIFI